MEIRPFTLNDVGALEDFLARIPSGESAFFKEDIAATRSAEHWSVTGRHRFLALEADGTVVGYSALISGVGWSSHVGDLSLFVDPERRRAGIGRQLARRTLQRALRLGLRKIVVEVLAEQEPQIAMFTDLGFVPEALLHDHIRDRNGQFHDLMVLCHYVDDAAGNMSSLGIGNEVR
jgi:L-amino acid N-acyltransferase YncA